MNSLSLADLVLDYADAAGVIVPWIGAEQLMRHATGSARFWHMELLYGIVLDGVVGIRADPIAFLEQTGHTWEVLGAAMMGSPRYATSYQFATPREAIIRALLWLTNERMRPVETDLRGSLAPVRRRGPVLATRLINAAGVSMGLRHSADSFKFDGAVLRPSQPPTLRGMWDVYATGAGAQDGWTEVAGVNLRLAFVTAIQLTLRQRLEALDL